MAKACRAQPIQQDALHEPRAAGLAGQTSFAWSRGKIRIGGLFLLSAALPAAAAFAIAVPFVKWLCLAWLLGIALLMRGLSRRARDDAAVLSVDQRGILDRRLMTRHIAWQEIAAIWPVNTDRAQTVDIALRWPKDTLGAT